MGQKSSAIYPRSSLYPDPDKSGSDFSEKEKKNIAEKLEKINTVDREIDVFAKNVNTPYDLSEIIKDIKKNWQKGVLNLSSHRYLHKKDIKALQDKDFIIDGQVIEIYPAIHQYTIKWNINDNPDEKLEIYNKRRQHL